MSDQQLELSTAIERAIVSDNLADLTPQQRMELIAYKCARFKLDPADRPFRYVDFYDDKSKSRVLQLYTTADASDQIAANFHVTFDSLERSIVKTESGESVVYQVWAEIPDEKINKRRRPDNGAASLKGIAGSSLANAFMVAMTRCLRRATLGIVGVGTLDESEVEELPEAKIVDIS